MKKKTISQLKQMTAKEIRDGGCFEVTADDDSVCFVMVGAVQIMRDRLISMASQIDLARGK